MNQGLSSSEAARLLEKYGKNELDSERSSNIIIKFLAQLNDFMIYTLLIAAGLSFAISYINGEPDYIEPSIILLIIVVNGIIGVIQEAKAEHSINALKTMAAPSAIVLRDSNWSKIQASSLVPGDIIRLETGCLVPADAKLLTSDNLMSDESPLTGESVPVNKSSDHTRSDSNMVFSGCTICYGHGTAVVTHTGMSTKIGKVAGMLMNEKTPLTPLQKKLALTGRTLSITALIICIIIFIIGLAKRIPVLEIFMTSVSLAVAAIPEGLPAIVTIMLSIGVTRMAANKAIIRRLPAVETLGSTTVICSDKTGTLTQNKMTVTETYSHNLTESSGSNIGNTTLYLGALCNNSIIQKNSIIGEPTENALLSAASNITSIDNLINICPRIKEYPFDSSRKLMTTIHRYKGSSFSATKGAPDVLIALCSYYMDNNYQIHPLDSDKKGKLLSLNNTLAGQGLRVIAVAWNNTSDLRKSVLERNMIFTGLLTMIDPPRPEVKAAIKQCKTAGIRTVMITGDHAATAAKIAADLKISDTGKKVITGIMLDNMTDTELYNNISTCNVYARVSPEHKLRIVKALSRHGEITAMTGDGVNDAPALKAADIGCSMGLTGTDVARNASDMILEDDNFATIAVAVREGRNIYDNIKKAIHFLISCNIGEILTIFMSILLGLAAPLFPVQLLWINLVTDSLPALSLGFEPADKDIMSRPPLPQNKSVFSDGMGIRIITEGILIGSTALLAYAIGNRINPAAANTMCFGVLGLSQISHSFNSRSDHSIFKIGLLGNIRLVLSGIICIALQLIVICMPALNHVFNTISLGKTEWIIVALLSLLPIPIVELQKLIRQTAS